ncbi:MAG: hypothetical protein NW220_24570 [Leptolyngbyaceae cyanobacterium bins.349]|nr:hypothetical protein [Leptolyngbyaceae cyanobacterium bins.349]
MNTNQTSSLFTDLSTEESQTLQGGCHRWSSRRSFYYYSRPMTYAHQPTFTYGYGFGRNSGGSVNQSVNVNVRYDD